MRYVYIIKSGTLNKSTNTYWFTDSYFSSLKGAKREFDQILVINKAEDIVTDELLIKVDDDVINFLDYVGEGGKYKGRLILKKKELKTF